MQPASDPARSFQAAIRAFEARNWAQAQALCEQLLAAEPAHVDALQMLGLVLHETNRPQDAIPYLRQAVALRPQNANLWTNLGLVYRQAGQLAEAADCQLRAIALRDNFPEAYVNLGLVYDDLGRFEDALAALRRAIELRPGYALAHYKLANLLREDGRFKSALAEYQTALAIRRDWPDAHLNIAATYCELGEPQLAIEHYRELLRLEPGRREAENSLGHALRTLGRIEEAKAAYARAESAASDCPMAALFRETLAEVVPVGRRAMDQHRQRLSAALDGFRSQARSLDLAELHTRGAMPSMMLAYQGGDVRPILEQFAHAIAPLVPRTPLRPRHGKPKVGIVVSHGHEGVFSRCWGGIAERLSRERFDVRLVCSRAGANVLQTISQFRREEFVCVPADIGAAASQIAAQEFDWLHYWETGTDQMNYYLPFFRAAPGQSTCWGWPVTSGNAYVDAYLSCEDLEPPDGDAHYTEQLIRLRHLPTYYVRPGAPQGELTKGRFGLDDRMHVYLCTQNVRKYHPDFDALLADLLRADANAVLAMIGDPQAAITELLLERFRRTMPDVMDKVHVIERMERDEYLSLVAAADVMLDTLHYGAGANTVYDAVAVGTPIVTLPGAFHRGRWAAAVNRRLGLPQLIAATPEDYVSQTVEIAGNADLRESLRLQILAAGAELFEHQSVVAEHDEFFSEAIAARRSSFPA